MPESTSNIEFAQKLHEEAHHEPPPADHRHTWLSIGEALLLAVVAIATAWSGYQASRWNAFSAEEYARMSRSFGTANEKVNLAGQLRLYDALNMNNWLNAKSEGREKLADFYQRRFRPEFRVAFDAWIKLDPFNDASAPPGPQVLPEYSNAAEEEAARLHEESTRHFEEAIKMGERADQYVKITVLLATVLFLTALSQRFHAFWPRACIIALGALLLLASIYNIVRLPTA